MLWEHPAVKFLAWIIEKEDLAQFPKHAHAEDLLHVHAIENDRDLQKVFSKLEPVDLGVVSNFGIILSKTSIEKAAMGFVNTHFGLLPENPGRNPIQKVLTEQKQLTGATLHQVTPQVDSGPILGKPPESTGGQNHQADQCHHHALPLFHRVLLIASVPAAVDTRGRPGR